MLLMVVYKILYLFILKCVCESVCVVWRFLVCVSLPQDERVSIAHLKAAESDAPLSREERGSALTPSALPVLLI